VIETFEDTYHHITQIYLTELGRHGLKIALPPPPTMTSKSTIDHPSSPSYNSNQVQNDNLLSFEFSLPVHDVLGHLIAGIPGIITKGHNEKQIWFSGILDKSSGQVISAAIGRRKTSLDGDTCDENTDYDYDR
jgi:hypothetical protein